MSCTYASTRLVRDLFCAYSYRTKASCEAISHDEQDHGSGSREYAFSKWYRLILINAKKQNWNVDASKSDGARSTRMSLTLFRDPQVHV